MNLCEFINTYIKTKVDYDNYYGAQCVDLFRQYCKDVLNIPHTGAVIGAKDLFLSYDNLPLEQKYFERISGSDDIQYGDVIVWDGVGFGHVAIVLTLVQDMALVFEQDGYTQAGAKIAMHPIHTMLGVLRRRHETDTDYKTY